jgi:hypothetical protein
MAHDKWFANYGPNWCACFCISPKDSDPFYRDIRSHSLLDAVCDLFSLYGEGLVIHSWYQFTADGPVSKD